MLHINFERYLLFLLVFTRMSGAFLFHPFFGRRNVPAIAKIGLALLMTILITPVLDIPVLVFPSTLSFVLAILIEMFIGYAMGLVMNLFISFVLMAGEVMDMEMGMGMSKIYDPQSNVSMPITGTVFNILITLIFFVSDGHLTLIKIVSESCGLFPPGRMFINFEVGNYMILLLGDILILMLKLAMPVLAIEFLAEAGLGVLMRIVPQINVFVVGLQLKLVIGLAVIILALPAISKLMDISLSFMYEKILESMSVMLS